MTVNVLTNAFFDLPRYRPRRRKSIAPMRDHMRDDSPRLGVAHGDAVRPEVRGEIVRKKAEEVTHSCHSERSEESPAKEC
jgi:hypothetical protein